MIGHKRITEAAGCSDTSVGEHSNGVESEGVSRGGAVGKANVGISNDNQGGKP